MKKNGKIAKKCDYQFDRIFYAIFKYSILIQEFWKVTFWANVTQQFIFHAVCNSSIKRLILLFKASYTPKMFQSWEWCGNVLYQGVPKQATFALKNFCLLNLPIFSVKVFHPRGQSTPFTVLSQQLTVQRKNNFLYSLLKIESKNGLVWRVP